MMLQGLFVLAVSTVYLSSVSFPSTWLLENPGFTYNQRTGEVRLGGMAIGQGYSGKGDGLNNPAKEAVANVGPIPVGEYKVGPPREFKGMNTCFDLTPVGHRAHGRTAFLIHGDNQRGDRSASEGCIILSWEIRKKIAEAKVTRLRVIRD